MAVFLDLGNRERRDYYLRAMRKEGIPASGPGGSVVLPTNERIEKKVTLHPDWPSFNTPQGKAMRYGRECCERTIHILDSAGGVRMDPNYTDQDVKDVITAIRKVHTAMNTA